MSQNGTFNDAHILVIVFNPPEVGTFVLLNYSESTNPYLKYIFEG